MFTNVDAEMKRRESLIKSDISKYWDSRIHPNRDCPYILISIDELAVIGTAIKEDKELEAVRKHAMYMLNELLFRARSSAISVIAAVQRPSTDILPGTTRNNFQNRLVGRVDTSSSSDVCLGLGMAASGVDASKLTDHWFIAQIEGKGIFRFKTPGEFDDSDLKDVALNPRYYCPKGRGDWLTAEPDTPEAIAPWWPDSPYHEAFLNGFRDEGDEEDGEYDYEPVDEPSDEYDDEYDDLDECEPFWEEPDYEPASRPASRSRRGSADSSGYEMPWDEPERPARRSPSRSDYEGIKETSLEDLMDMVVDPSTVPQPKSKPNSSGPRVEYRRRSSSPSPSEVVDDLNSFFQEVDDGDEAFWGDQVVGDSDDDELLDDYETAMRDVVKASGEEDHAPLMALPPHEYKSHPSHREPAPYPTQTPIGERKQVVEDASEPRTQDAVPSGKKPASSRLRKSDASPSKKDSEDGAKKPVRRRRRRYEVEEEFLNPPGHRPKMINGMPVL